MKNNIALSYFIDYMTAIGLCVFRINYPYILFLCFSIFILDLKLFLGCQYFVFFYLNIEGWKVSAEQQLQAIELDFLKTGNSEKQVHLSIDFLKTGNSEKQVQISN